MSQGNYRDANGRGEGAEFIADADRPESPVDAIHAQAGAERRPADLLDARVSALESPRRGCSEESLYADLGSLCRFHLGRAAVLFDVNSVEASDMRRMTSHYGVDADTAASIADRVRDTVAEDAMVRSAPFGLQFAADGKIFFVHVIPGGKDGFGQQFLAFASADPLATADVAELAYLALVVMETVARVPRLRIPDFDDFSLSRQEANCLHWIAEGKTSEEVALILEISPHTVNHYITSATRKLNSSNRTHAVTKAMRLGLI